MKATTQTKQRTPQAEAALRRANAEFYRLANDPAACVALWERLGVPLIAPALRAEAKRTFREQIGDDKFRAEFCIWVYRGALKLYQSGALD